MSSPFLIMSSSTMILSTMMAISSSNWLFLWMALELNLLSFMPILLSSKNAQETEAAVKYFLIQATSSSLLLFGSLSMWFILHELHGFMPTLLMMALMMKMGMVPLHMWYPSVMTSISWMAALILSTWQKLAPLIILASVFNKSNTNFMLLMASINAIVGGLIGLNQSHLRTIMAYSSITHMGWMMSLIALMKPIATMLYFLIYVIIISPMFIMLHIKKISNTNSVNKLSNMSPMYQFSIPFILLSLSGLPPLTGFIPKWMTISILAHSNPAITITLIIGSMMNAYFYLNIAFNFLLSMKMYPNFNMSPLNLNMKFYMSLATASMFLVPMIMMF